MAFEANSFLNEELGSEKGITWGKRTKEEKKRLSYFYSLFNYYFLPRNVISVNSYFMEEFDYF